MNLRVRLVVFFTMALAAGAVIVGVALAGSKATAPSADKLVVGKALYRKFCGQCHALSQADAAGFGAFGNGLGQDGGPSFNNLKVPYDLSVSAITGSFAGHDVVIRRMTFPEIYEVSAFTAAATAHNPYLARISDG